MVTMFNEGTITRRLSAMDISLSDVKKAYYDELKASKEKLKIERLTGVEMMEKMSDSDVASRLTSTNVSGANVSLATVSVNQFQCFYDAARGRTEIEADYAGAFNWAQSAPNGTVVVYEFDSTDSVFESRYTKINGEWFHTYYHDKKPDTYYDDWVTPKSVAERLGTNISPDLHYIVINLNETGKFFG